MLLGRRRVCTVYGPSSLRMACHTSKVVQKASKMGFLQRFPKTLKYVPGSKNKADPISRASHLSIDVSAHMSPEGGSSNSTHNLMVAATKAQTLKHHR
jgi:hypothetical protein